VGSLTFNHWYEHTGRGLLGRVYASTSSGKPSMPDAVYSYRPSGAVASRQFLGGSAGALLYTVREELETIGNPATTTHPFAARYTYHPNGLVSESEFYSAGAPGGGAATANRYRYVYGAGQYDALGRLLGATYQGWTGSWSSTLAHNLTGISYDPSGNITAMRRYREDGTLIDDLTYSYPGSSNRLSSVTDAASATLGWDAQSGSFTYDANGNMTSSPAPYSVTGAAYDHRNLPTALTSGSTTTAYRYNHAGQRTHKRVGSGNTEIYVVEGTVTLGVVTVDGSGALVSSTFNVLADGQVIGRQETGGARLHYHRDLLGSTRAVTEGATVVESYDYDPWGVLMPGRALVGTTREGFTTKERDLETGLDYFGARYYMAALGRWTTVDPPADEFPEWSPYNYVMNNPVNARDLLGLCPQWLTGEPCLAPVASPMRAADAWSPSGAGGSEFGWTRSGGTQWHGGFDWAAGVGTPVHAPAEATVRFVPEEIGGDAGNHVQLDFGNGTSMSILHLSAFNKDLSSGDVVPAGTVLGFTGITGNADPAVSRREPHAHITTRVGGRACNPRDFLSSDGGGGSCF
jgi:RHS repeat-associated protein